MWAYRAWLYIIYKQGKGIERSFLIFILKQTFFRVIGIGAYPPFLIQGKRIKIGGGTKQAICYLMYYNL